VKLPAIRELDESSAGWAFYLCTRKEVRNGRDGEAFVSLVLQDRTGRIPAKIFENVDTLRDEFDAGEFVKVDARGNRHHDRLELLVERIRRVNPPQDGPDGFREDDYIPSAPRALDEMWGELVDRVGGVSDPWIRRLLERVLERHGERLRTWPAAVTVHHAYRGGLLEHVLKLAETGAALAASYGANADLVVAGAVLHDIGKLEELSYDGATAYSTAGNLLGHITLGVMLVRAHHRPLRGFPPRC
jgi:3'-5' exoribonuclease